MKIRLLTLAPLTLAPLTLALLPSFALATTQTISDRDPNEALARVPNRLISVFLNSGFQFKKLNDGIFLMSAKNVHCDYRHNGALDSEDPKAGVATTSCRVNSEDVKDSRKGKVVKESYALLEALGDLKLDDCAMGYCGAFAEAIDCTVDTKIGNQSGEGRFTCTIESGQE